MTKTLDKSVTSSREHLLLIVLILDRFPRIQSGYLVGHLLGLLLEQLALFALLLALAALLVVDGRRRGGSRLY